MPTRITILVALLFGLAASSLAAPARRSRLRVLEVMVIAPQGPLEGDRFDVTVQVICELPEALFKQRKGKPLTRVALTLNGRPLEAKEYTAIPALAREVYGAPAPRRGSPVVKVADEFGFEKIRIPAGAREVKIRATAYDETGRRVATRDVTLAVAAGP